MIKVIADLFILETKQSQYIFHCLPSGHLEHLHYGSKVLLGEDDDSLRKQAQSLTREWAYLPGNTIAYGDDYENLGLEILPQEISSYGKGDVREPFLMIEDDRGVSTRDFVYETSRTMPGKNAYTDLPSSYGTDEEVDTLVVTLKDRNSALVLDLYYHVYEGCDVITRSCCLRNEGDLAVIVKRLMSTQIDFKQGSYQLTTFSGAWSREMEKETSELKRGLTAVSSIAGVSSNRFNPFIIVSEKAATEESGECYGFNLVYSGNHYSGLYVDGYDRCRLVSGMNDRGFQWLLTPSEAFQTPESVMTYSNHGMSSMSLQMHHFIRQHIVRGHWQFKERPILINSWEASYFDFNQSSLLKLAKQAKKVGIELFVLDDGWFGKRSDDTSSLGDWYVNNKKLPGGLKELSQKIHDLEMLFGIWVEPEMVNEDSDLYRQHPEWAVAIPGFHHAKGRHQMLLDLTNQEVIDHLIEAMSRVFSSGQIDYVKWDMNRIVSDAYSQTLNANQQGEFYHRYVLGLYRLLTSLTQKFPEILFEGCASGGNRFDLGMLCYMPQIWASDNTDAMSRLSIQEGYSYGYPQSVMGAHVSDCPNHQTLRQVPLETRFNVAAFGLLGYECNLVDFLKEDIEHITAQVSLYKTHRQVFQFGDFYRLPLTGMSKNKGFMVVSPDETKAIACQYQEQVRPNAGERLFLGRGLKPSAIYRLYSLPHPINVKVFGDLINMASPVHIKNGSLVQHLVSKVYKLPGEIEEHTASGQLICQVGVPLKQGYIGTGFNEQVSVYQDYASRMYFIEMENE